MTEIPISAERPHIPNYKEEKRIFRKRTNKGNEFMSYEEIKLSFERLNERKEKIRLLYVELISDKELLQSKLCTFPGNNFIIAFRNSRFFRECWKIE